MGRLTVKGIEKLSEPGMYGDGDGLYLRVGPTGSKSWVLRTMVFAKRREFGLGSAKLIKPNEARDEARRLRKVARQGGDPEVLRKKASLTFEQAARKKHAELLPSWRPGHGDRWISSLERYVFPVLGAKRIDTISTADVLGVLTPIWVTKHDTARRVLQRVRVVFDWAKGLGHYPHENPTHGVVEALPTVRHEQEHMASLAWRELPRFMSELAGREGVSARALEFAILTCLRSKEVRGALWSEIHGDVWEVPGARMKAGTAHRVPLSPEALEVLDRVRGLDPVLVFPSTSKGPQGAAKPMSDAVFRALFNRMGRSGFTTHGFRSTFRDWCSESAHADTEVAETALAHKVGSKVQRAYARSDLFDRRKELMDAWGRYSTGKSGYVVELVRA